MQRVLKIFLEGTAPVVCGLLTSGSYQATMPLMTTKPRPAMTGTAASVLKVITMISCFVCSSILLSDRLLAMHNAQPAD